jgi:hypothetical protein
MQEINIKLWLNDEADWSIEIDDIRHDHVTNKIMEDLVEATLITVQTGMTNTATRKSSAEMMLESKNVSKKTNLTEFVLPQERIEAELESWVRRVLESNDALVAALERIRSSYASVMAGKSVKNVGEILVAVEPALKKAEKAKNVG